MTETREEMTQAERLMHLKTVLEAHEWRKSRINATVHRNNEAQHYAKVLWRAGVLNRHALSRLLGCARQTVYNWLPDDGRTRMRAAPKDFESLRYLLLVAEQRDEGREIDWKKVVDDLKQAGVPEVFTRFSLGPDLPEQLVIKRKPRRKDKPVEADAPAEEPAETKPKPKPAKKKKKKKPAPAAPATPEEVPGDTDGLRAQDRPDEPGHPEGGEGFSIRLYKDPIDHGPGYSTPVTESGDAGDVRGTAARGADTDAEPNEGKSGSAVNSLLDPAELSDAEYIEALESGRTWVQPGRQPFSVEPIDLDGDSYLEDLPLPPPSGELATGFQEWEQSEES